MPVNAWIKQYERPDEYFGPHRYATSFPELQEHGNETIGFCLVSSLEHYIPRFRNEKQDTCQTTQVLNTCPKTSPTLCKLYRRLIQLASHYFLFLKVMLCRIQSVTNNLRWGHREFGISKRCRNIGTE